MSVDNTPNEYFYNIIYNSEFFDNNNFITQDYGNNNYLSRLYTAISIAPSTTFNGIVNVNNNLNTTNIINNSLINTNSLNASFISISGISLNNLYCSLNYDNNINGINTFNNIVKLNNIQNINNSDNVTLYNNITSGNVDVLNNVNWSGSLNIATVRANFINNINIGNLFNNSSFGSGLINLGILNGDCYILSRSYFNNYLPTTTIYPINNNQLINKSYCDNNINSLSGVIYNNYNILNNNINNVYFYSVSLSGLVNYNYYYQQTQNNLLFNYSYTISGNVNNYFINQDLYNNNNNLNIQTLSNNIFINNQANQQYFNQNNLNIQTLSNNIFINNQNNQIYFNQNNLNIQTLSNNIFINNQNNQIYFNQNNLNINSLSGLIFNYNKNNQVYFNQNNLIYSTLSNNIFINNKNQQVYNNQNNLNIQSLSGQVAYLQYTLTNAIYDDVYSTLNFYNSVHAYSDFILSSGLTIQTLPYYDTYYISNEALININYALTISNTIYNNIWVSQDNTTTPLFFSFVDNFVSGGYQFKTDSGASYNASLNSITASRFYGVHYGNIQATVATSNYSIYSATTTGIITLANNTISGSYLQLGGQGVTNINGSFVNAPNPKNDNSFEVVNTNYLKSNYSPILNGNPTGTIIMHAAFNSLSGYLLCDGSLYNPVIFPALYSVISNLYGGVYNPSTFPPQYPRLPDFRGAFIRGFNDGTTPNPNGVVGPSNYISSYIGNGQGDQTGQHNHPTNMSGYYGGSQSTLLKATGASTYITGNNTCPTFTGTNAVGSTTENRPYNFAIYYFIKY